MNLEDAIGTAYLDYDQSQEDAVTLEQIQRCVQPPRHKVKTTYILRVNIYI